MVEQATAAVEQDGHRGHLLEGRIPPDDYIQLQTAATADWDLAALQAEDARSAIEEVVFRRHDNTVRHVVPWLEPHLPLAPEHLIDFGSGCGSSALALSHFARRVDGFEIDATAVAAARLRMQLFGADNVTIHHATPAAIIGEALERIGRDTSVVLNAVVEHLLESEQLPYLRSLWNKLAPGRVLAITETPNFYSWFDGHTFRRPFTAMIPDAFFPLVIERSPPTLRFREALLEEGRRRGPAAMLEKRRRYGLGVTHHLFELAFSEDLNALVVSDGYHPAMLDWFGIQPDDRLLLSAFELYDIKLPVGFARPVLAFVFKKPQSSADAQAAREWNAEWRKQTIATHSLYAEKMAYQRLVEQSARGA